MSRFLSLAEAVEVDHPGRRHRGHGGLHPSHSACGRARGHPPGPPASHAHPDDARPDLRPADRHGLRRQAGLLLGRQSRRRLAAPLPRRRRERLAAAARRSRSIRHAAMANAYEAGAAGLPFAVFRGYLGVDLPKVNPNIKLVTCPFTGEALAAVPAIRPDVAVIHAQQGRPRRQRADRGHRRRAEGGGAGGEALARHGRGDRRRLRRRAAPTR